MATTTGKPYTCKWCKTSIFSDAGAPPVEWITLLASLGSKEQRPRFLGYFCELRCLRFHLEYEARQEEVEYPDLVP